MTDETKRSAGVCPRLPARSGRATWVGLAPGLIALAVVRWGRMPGRPERPRCPRRSPRSSARRRSSPATSALTGRP